MSEALEILKSCDAFLEGHFLLFLRPPFQRILPDGLPAAVPRPLRRGDEDRGR